MVGGVGLAVLFAQSKWVEMSFFPFAIVLQVTPIVAIFPLINIYVDNQTAKLLLCSWIVAFFPILSNTTLGLNSVDRNLLDLFKLNGATRWQQLALPAPAGGDALFPRRPEDRRRPVADRRGGGRVRRRRRRASRRGLPRASSRPATGSTRRGCFAALILISLTGILIFLVLSLISHLILRRWHESALKQER